jgi:hypothetical protein
LSILETVLIFAGIPIAVAVVVAGLVYAGGGARRSKRYRPGREFEFRPVWFLSAPQTLGGEARSALSGGKSEPPGEVGAVPVEPVELSAAGESGADARAADARAGDARAADEPAGGARAGEVGARDVRAGDGRNGHAATAHGRGGPAAAAGMDEWPAPGPAGANGGASDRW